MPAPRSPGCQSDFHVGKLSTADQCWRVCHTAPHGILRTWKSGGTKNVGNIRVGPKFHSRLTGMPVSDPAAQSYASKKGASLPKRAQQLPPGRYQVPTNTKSFQACNKHPASAFPPQKLCLMWQRNASAQKMRNANPCVRNCFSGSHCQPLKLCGFCVWHGLCIKPGSAFGTAVWRFMTARKNK